VQDKNEFSTSENLKFRSQGHSMNLNCSTCTLCKV